MIWLFWIFPLTLKAATLEQEYVQRLNRAQASQVDGLFDHFERIRVLRLACRLQLKEKKVPSACYEAVAAEDKWIPRPKAKAEALRKELDERCARAARRLNVPSRGNLRPELSASCRKKVEEAWRIQAYRQGGEAWSSD